MSRKVGQLFFIMISFTGLVTSRLWFACWGHMTAVLIMWSFVVAFLDSCDQMNHLCSVFTQWSVTLCSNDSVSVKNRDSYVIIWIICVQCSRWWVLTLWSYDSFVCAVIGGWFDSVASGVRSVMNRALLAVCVALVAAVGEPLSVPPHEEVARMARFVVNKCDWASMATISTHDPVKGQPFSNAFSISDGPVGNGTGTPYMYLTHMEISVQDLQVRINTDR